MSRAIVLVDHGSRRDEANALLERVAEAVRRRREDAIVEIAHLELLEPSLASALDRCVERGASEAVVCLWFLAPGRHSTSDIPKLVEEARARHPALRVAVSEPLGFDEGMVDLLLARADAALR